MTYLECVSNETEALNLYLSSLITGTIESETLKCGNVSLIVLKYVPNQKWNNYKCEYKNPKKCFVCEKSILRIMLHEVLKLVNI